MARTNPSTKSTDSNESTTSDDQGFRDVVRQINDDMKTLFRAASVEGQEKMHAHERKFLSDTMSLEDEFTACMRNGLRVADVLRLSAKTLRMIQKVIFAEVATTVRNARYVLARLVRLLVFIGYAGVRLVGAIFAGIFGFAKRLVSRPATESDGVQAGQLATTLEAS